MNQSETSLKETRKGLSDGETTQSSDMSTCYEINVHENFSSDSDTSKGSGFFYVRPKLMVKVKKVGGNKNEKTNNHNTHLFVENLKKIANPLIESYYPFLEEHQIGNISIEIKLSSTDADRKESEQKIENVCKSVDEKSSVNSKDGSSKKSYGSVIISDNQDTKEEKKLAVTSFSKLRKKLKRQILQDMLTKKDGEFKDVQWKDIDEPLHIHHHEHHHHYYVDASKLKEESEFSLLPGVSNSPVLWPENKENECRTTDTLNSDVDVKERERSSYLYDCSRHHPVHVLLEKNNCNIANLTFLRKSKEEYAKIADKCSYRTAPIKPVKKASSMDSLEQKKSDYIIFHNYSDTEVSKCDSEESNSTDAPSFALNMKKNAKAEHKRSKLLGEENETVAGNVIQGNNRSSSVLKKLSHEPQKNKTSTEKISRKLDYQMKTLEEKNEDSKGELEDSVEKKGEKSAGVKTDKEMSDDNALTSTTRTSAKDTATVTETSEVGLSNSDEKCSGSKPSKSAGNSGEKMKSSSRKKGDGNGQDELKSKQTFGISGNSKNKGVFRCYYTYSRNRECNITLTVAKNQKRATESSKSSDGGNTERKEGDHC